MDSNTARNALVGVLAVVIAVLLVAVGYLGRVVLDDDEPGAAQAETATTDAEAAADRLSEIDFALIEEIIGILEKDFVEPDRVDRELLYEGADQRPVPGARRPALGVYRPADLRGLAR